MSKQTLKVRKVLVVVKQPVLERYRKQGKRASKLAPGYLRNIREGEKRHREAVTQVKAALRRAGLAFEMSGTGKAKQGGFDLLLAVGGDGTLLRAAHRYYHPSLAVLGVNSDPKRSTGFLCRATAGDFNSKLEKLLAGQCRLLALSRLRLRLDGRELAERPLNDVLIANAIPVCQSRYVLGVGGKREEQRRSGIWVATAVGSSSVIGAIGGRQLPLAAKIIQYAVREPCFSRGKFRLVSGRLAPGDKLRMRSMMAQGRIYLDGAGCSYAFGLGSELVIDRAPKPLLLVDF